MAGALIVAAEIGARDFTCLDQLRRAYYPADRNRVAAHLTMFHALPPSAEPEVRRTLARFASEAPPGASIEGLMDLGGGVAFRVVSPGLDRIRSELAERFHGLLSAQDSGGWRPHVMIQNKVPPKDARALIAKLEADFRPRALAVSGLGLHRYLPAGNWEKIATWSFRGR
jgi:hypothetical protein